MREKTLYSDYYKFKDNAYRFYEHYTKEMLIERIAMIELQLYRLQEKQFSRKSKAKRKLQL